MKTRIALFDLSRKWIYQNARPLDFARWQYHFENGSADNVLKTLSAYQNNDGGFGYALEADSWNPYSSPVQTWAAIEILREINVVDRQNNIVQGILHYLDSGKDFTDGVWQNTIPTNNDYPHAFWWGWSESTRHYNPTANLCGFIIKYADKKSGLFNKGVSIAKEAVDYFLRTTNANEIGDGHINLCFLRLKQCCEEANEISHFDIVSVENQLLKNIKIEDTNIDWCCDGVAFEFIKSYRNNIDQVSSKVDIIETVCNYLIENQQKDGTWDIPWNWNSYPEEWAVSKNWWKAYGIIVNMLFLKQFGYIL